MSLIFCKFCNKNITNCAYQKPKGEDWERYQCEPCLSDCSCYYHIVKGGDITEYQFNYRGYCFRFDLVKKVFRLFSTKGKDFTDMIRLDFLPDISPRNVKQKLPTLLTFL